MSEKCVSEIELWMKANLLKLNTEKTEILVLGTKSVIRKYHLDDFRVGVSSIGQYFLTGSKYIMPCITLETDVNVYQEASQRS